MNLIARITLLFVFVSLIVFLIGGVISFKIMMREVDFEQQRFLIERLDRAERIIERRNPSDTLKWSKMMIIPLAEAQEEYTIFSDTVVMHSQIERLESHLKLESVRNIEGKSYLISMYDVIIEQDDIQDGLVESLTTMYILLLGAVLIIGFFASYFILKPFNKTLSVIQSISLTKTDQEVHFPKSNVLEFKKLNLFLGEMTRKMKSDYQALKEFSDNASHELQTPLAIVQSKLEVLMDADNLSENQVNQISSAHSTIKRLSVLGNSLSLLTKIDNKEFENVTEVNLSETVEGILEEFQELIQLKKIEVQSDIEENVLLKVDKVLVELMITNLMNNSIRHNHEEGSISIQVKNDHLEIKNTGEELSLDTSELFQRFKKSNQSSSSLGLGLAIVKRICDLYNFEISYLQSNNYHTLRVTFPSK